MHLLDITKAAVELYESGTALHLVGPPGVGKSQVLRNEFRAVLSQHYGKEFGFWDILLPTLDAPDLRGFLIPTKDKDGTPTSFFTRSAALPPKEYLAEFPQGVYVIDERNAADLLTLKAIAPIVLSGRFGDDYLPGFSAEGNSATGWMVVSASNRQSDRSGVNKAPRHLENRERTLEVEPDIIGWSRWAEARGMHPMLIAFAKQRPGIVCSDSVPKEEGPFCTPRSFTSAARLLELAAGKDANGDPNMMIPNTGVIMQMVGGDIGSKACSELFGWLKVVDELPTIDEILKGPSTCKCPKDLSAAYAALQMIVHFAKGDNIDKLWTFAERMPKELQTTTAKSLIEKGGGALLNSPALNKWIMSNKALINASAAK